MAIPGEFDLLVDHGTFDDLGPGDRDRYASTATRIAAPRATFYLWCFEWAPVRWERWLTRILPVGGVNVEPREVAPILTVVDRRASRNRHIRAQVATPVGHLPDEQEVDSPTTAPST